MGGGGHILKSFPYELVTVCINIQKRLINLYIYLVYTQTMLLFLLDHVITI